MNNGGPVPPTDDKVFDFAAFLASAAHDMKNALGMLLNTTSQIISECSGNNCTSYPLLSRLHYEAKRVNNNLLQLLTLYKIDKSLLALNIDQHDVGEFLEETKLYNGPLDGARGIRIEIECPDNLFWFFDRDLVSGILNNVLNNAFRYARSRIIIKAFKDDEGFLVISLKDDGDGYPQFMLNSEGSASRRTVFSTGSTGLGLLFADTVAGMHTNRGRKGLISLSNCAEEGGGCFSLYLP